MARQLSVEMPDGEFKTNLRLQRDTHTEDWVERFQDDAKSKSPLAHLPEHVAPRNIDNLARFLLKKQMPISEGLGSLFEPSGMYVLGAGSGNRTRAFSLGS